MNKMIGVAEFKKNCTRIISDIEQSGEPVTVTKRGRAVAVMTPAQPKRKRSLLGLMAKEGYRFDDPYSPVYDKPWNAELGIRGDED